MSTLIEDTASLVKNAKINILTKSAMKDAESLGTHLSTCEIYECDLCYFRVKQISEMKSHMENKHKDCNSRIWHAKVDRNNEEVIDASEHWKLELFPKNK